MGMHVLDRQTQSTLPGPRQPQSIEVEAAAVIPDETTPEQYSVASERAKLWRLRLAAGVLATGAVTTSVYLAEYADNTATATVTSPVTAK